MNVLRSSWQVALAAGEPHSTIRVRNLQATVKVGRDAWGRPGKLQPVLISATISLREPFEKAVADDSVDNTSTVHYGILSKAILEAVEAFPTAQTAGTLRCLLDHVLKHLTGIGLDFTGSTSRGESERPVIARPALKSLELNLLLPKASLIGNGVSLSVTTVYTIFGDAEMYSMGLKLHELRIPTLIGVNANERLAKQIVAANIELDSWSPPADLYNELEALVVKVRTPYSAVQV
jgi:dihydroneopterin aldolase